MLTAEAPVRKQRSPLFLSLRLLICWEICPCVLNSLLTHWLFCSLVVAKVYLNPGDIDCSGIINDCGSELPWPTSTGKAHVGKARDFLHLIWKYVVRSQWDGSAGIKGTWYQIWWPGFPPWNPLSRQRKLISSTCSTASTHGLWPARPRRYHIRTHKISLRKKC